MKGIKALKLQDTTFAALAIVVAFILIICGARAMAVGSAIALGASLFVFRDRLSSHRGPLAVALCLAVAVAVLVAVLLTMKSAPH